MTKKKRKILYSKESIIVIVIFLLLSAVLWIQKSGEQYTVNPEKNIYLKNAPSSNAVFDSLAQDNLVLYDENNDTSRRAKEQFTQILKDMRMGYRLVDISKETIPNFSDYKKVVVLLSDLEGMGDKALEMVDWVEQGGNVLFAVTLSKDSKLTEIEQKLGVSSSSFENAYVKKIYIDKNFMIGGGKSYAIDGAFHSAWSVTLSSDAKVHAWTDDDAKTPLVWEKKHGQGKFVVDNFGIYERAVRGLYAASYSLMTSATAYPVINGTTFYLDDFPSPVPAGDATYIKRDYNMSISDFYTNIWWPDLLKLAETYGIKYTGGVIENYEDDTSGNVHSQKDVDRFKYFGKSLLANGGEISYHGYNHQPLTPKGVDYGDEFPTYKTWKDKKAMASAISELLRFTKELFPKGEKSIYIPPSNVLSKEGREVLREKFPEIKSIASKYFPGKFTYSQEFEVADDGMIEQPRIVSGASWDAYSKLTVFSELNMHYVTTHFLHPDDVLDEDRGAKLGWPKLYKDFQNEIESLYKVVPNIRRLTGSEMAGAVQRYAILTINQNRTDTGLELELGNFHNQAYVMIRLNEGEPGKVKGGKLEHLTGNLYLLEATSAKVSIEVK
ncbi:DUF2194 domain-containing protein [Streptococcus gordonii]|uniref:DUF2194 domain-containing protein n=1 Tax=Streptococcus gordonii TaxID=1302 RepID=UPI000779AA6A|nr:DUF2194 domain-containing protein [Streptococcus gordonii]